MPSTNLKNINIDQRQTLSGETYFIIRDNDNNTAYFCFQDKLKKDWDNLVSNWTNLKEIEIEYLEKERGNKVISLSTNHGGEFVF